MRWMRVIAALGANVALACGAVAMSDAKKGDVRWPVATSRMFALLFFANGSLLLWIAFS